MKKIWKGLLAVLACGMLACGAAACGGESSSSDKNESSSSVNVECEHTVEEWIRSNEQTCDNALFYGTCTTCNEAIFDVGREHIYGERTTVGATCTTGGYDWTVCSVCGFEEKSNEVQSLPHDFGEWETYQAATCYLAGEEIRYCKRDGCTHSLYDATPYYESRTIDAIAPTEGHNVSNGKCTRCQKAENTDLRFIILNGAYHCVGMGNCKDRDIIIPKTYLDKPVTSIGDGAFENCYDLTNIEIPNSVTSIGDRAFEKCYDLTNIEIPNSVTSIGDMAFAYCWSLTSIEIPNSVTGIANSAFSNCDSLTSIEIPNSVTSIGNRAFSGCSSLISIEVDENNTTYQSIDGNLYTKDGKTLIQYAIGKTATSFVIPDTVTSIGDVAFYWCSGLTSIVIPDSVTSIGSSAFADCWSLTSIEIPNSVTSIGSSAFADCWSLTSIEIPNSVTSIGDFAFYNCVDLTSMEIPNSVTSIGNYAFCSCDDLTSIEIPNSVTSIGDDAFSWCRSLKSITYNGTMEEWNAIYKGSYWSNNVFATYVQCSDGKVDLT